MFSSGTGIASHPHSVWIALCELVPGAILDLRVGAVWLPARQHRLSNPFCCHVAAGWQYAGPLCESPDSNMWECPLLAQLTNTPPTSTASIGHQPIRRHLLSVSPDYCVNMVQYWLGDYAAGKFDMEAADGPHKLDLGDIMYAPNVLTDKQVGKDTLGVKEVSGGPTRADGAAGWGWVPSICAVMDCHNRGVGS